MSEAYKIIVEIQACVLPAERVWCVRSRPQYGLNLLQRRLFVGRPASLMGGSVAIPIDSSIGSVVFSAFRHVEQSQLGTIWEANRGGDVVWALKLEWSWTPDV